MQSSSANPDRRPLPVGWISHFDPQRRLWYYINLNEIPPRATYLHPEDEDPPSPPIANSPLPPVNVPSMNAVPQVPAVHRRSSTQGGTPFSNVMQAYHSKRPSFAQQLYASAATEEDTPSTPTSSDREFERTPTYITNFQLSNSPAEEFQLSPSPSTLSYAPNPVQGLRPSPSSRSPPSPSLSPDRSRQPPQRPRGARSPTASTFPRPLPVAGPSYTLPPVSENQAANDFRDRALFNSSPPDSAPPSTTQNPQNAITFRRPRRSATLPSKHSVAPPLSLGVIAKPKETPMYSTVARPQEISRNRTKTTPAFQNLQPMTGIQTVPFPLSANGVRPALVAAAPFTRPISGTPTIPQANTQILPTLQNLPVVQPANIVQQAPVTTSPVSVDVQDDQAEKERKQKALKKMGVAVGKSAGKMALRFGTKMALGSIGIPIDTSNMFSSDGDGVVDAIKTGVTELATSAATAGVKQAVNAATTPTTTTNTHSSLQSLTTASPQPTLSMVPQPSMSHAEYATLLNQMQAMQLAQQQQNIPLRPINPADYASIQNQMQMMQAMQAMQRAQAIQPPNLPSSALPYPSVQAPVTQVAMPSQVNGTQSHGQVPAQGRWQQSLMNSVVEGATNAAVSSAMNNLDFAGTTDAVTNALSEYL